MSHVLSTEISWMRLSVPYKDFSLRGMDGSGVEKPCFFPWQLKLTCSHLNIDRLPQKERIIFQSSIFRCEHVSFREGKAISVALGLVGMVGRKKHLLDDGMVGRKNLLDDGMVGMDAFIMAGQPTPPLTYPPQK